MHGSIPPAAPDPTPAELISARPFLSQGTPDGLAFEGVPLAAIADALGTPTYVYSAGTIRARFAALTAALTAAGLSAHIHYAVKANDHLAVLRLLGRLGAGADVVSAGELGRALAAGIPAERIVFSGVGKTGAELARALEAGTGQINVESAEELAELSAIATGLGRIAPVALRVNPDIDAGTHAKITTGLAQNKFGIPAAEIPALYAQAARLPGIAPMGLALHIGSQILSLAPFRESFSVLARLVRELRASGFPLTRVDCGGGLGVAYRNEPAPTPEGLAGALAETFRGLDVALLLEPGRWLLAPAGLLLASVVRIKPGPERPFVVLDAGMNDLIRPALYEAWHGIVPLAPSLALTNAEPASADIVGPICESADTFATARALPSLVPGARVALLDAGAYGRVMGSAYNARPRAAEAMVDGERWALIRPRPPLASLWADELVPDWL
ncbi:MAG TPA: diaminopimelate decarboxylase [Acetobacteraceae bacterium]|nr:diaminopimelate decarboxylase [Acetobacteraceae bacterium]